MELYVTIYSAGVCRIHHLAMFHAGRSRLKKNNCNVHFPHRIKTHFVQIIAVLLFDDLHCKKRKSFFFLRHKNPEKLECLEFCSTLSQDVQHFMMLLPK